MPAWSGGKAFPSGLFTFNQVPCKTALPAGCVGRCGLKTNVKIGSTFSPQAGNFQTKHTETDTSGVGYTATLGIGCTARAHVNTDWVRGPNTVGRPPWGSPFLPAIGVTLLRLHHWVEPGCELGWY